MTPTAVLPELELRIERELHVDASLEDTFAALLEQAGPGMITPDGSPMTMVLETFPGGRWFRDLGDGTGHLWGHVQAIKSPTLLEICGPLFMSSPTANNVQYRLEANGAGTVVRFVHTAFGPLPDDVREGMPPGWDVHLARIAATATASAQGQ